MPQHEYKKCNAYPVCTFSNCDCLSIDLMIRSSEKCANENPIADKRDIIIGKSDLRKQIQDIINSTIVVGNKGTGDRIASEKIEQLFNNLIKNK
jgi:hypothetical protein